MSVTAQNSLESTNTSRLKKYIDKAHDLINPPIISKSSKKNPKYYRRQSIDNEKISHGTQAGVMILSAASSVLAYHQQPISSMTTSSAAMILDIYSKREAQKSVDNNNIALRQAAIKRTPDIEEEMKSQIDPITQKGDESRRIARTMYGARDILLVAALQTIQSGNTLGSAITIPLAVGFHIAAISNEIIGSEHYKKRNNFREKIELERLASKNNEISM